MNVTGVTLRKGWSEEQVAEAVRIGTSGTSAGVGKPVLVDSPSSSVEGSESP
jgi:hypothetical protein